MLFTFEEQWVVKWLSYFPICSPCLHVSFSSLWGYFVEMSTNVSFFLLFFFLEAKILLGPISIDNFFVLQNRPKKSKLKRKKDKILSGKNIVWLLKIYKMIEVLDCEAVYRVESSSLSLSPSLDGPSDNYY
jgi:hypothetical protein